MIDQLIISQKMNLYMMDVNSTVIHFNKYYRDHGKELADSSKYMLDQLVEYDYSESYEDKKRYLVRIDKLISNSKSIVAILYASHNLNEDKYNKYNSYLLEIGRLLGGLFRHLDRVKESLS